MVTADRDRGVACMGGLGFIFISRAFSNQFHLRSVQQSSHAKNHLTRVEFVDAATVGCD